MGRDLGEAVGGLGGARSEVIGDLRTAATRLVDLGFQTLVFAADHGHVFVPEILVGDVLAAPAGVWQAKKRRALLGKSRAAASGVIIVAAEDAGIRGPVA